MTVTHEENGRSAAQYVLGHCLLGLQQGPCMKSPWFPHDESTFEECSFVVVITELPVN